MRLDNGSSWRYGLLSKCLLVSVTVLCCVRNVSPYGLGAPDQACGDMTPRHGQTVPQSSAPPYSLLPNTTSIFGGERVMLELKAEAQGNPFKGFFLQARENENGSPMGSFYSTSSVPDSKIYTCSGSGSGKVFNNAVTHSSPDGKSSVKIEWEAPSDYEGDIIFRGTVVQSFNTIWTSLRSEKITIKKRSVVSQANTTPTQRPQSTAASPTQSASTGIEKSMAALYDGCGVDKSCFGIPSNCVDRKNCRSVTTYTFIGGGKYEFELYGTGGSNRYVSVALSNDTEMKNDSVVTCKSSNDNLIDISMSWNLDESNIDIRNPKEGIEELEKGNVDGKLYCRFTRAQVTNPNNNKVDLTNDEYHIMVAEGTVSQDNRIQYHSTNRDFSKKSVKLDETSRLEGGVDVRLFRIIHACFMIFAWVSAASCGILFARYYKQTWLRFRCCNIDQWFHCHRFFMITTWLLTMAALVIIWYALEKFNSSTHSIIGMTSIVLCFIQPFMAALRPHPDAKRRGVFNWFHWFVGNSAQILGITAIFFGYEMFLGEGRHWVKEMAWYTLIAFIAFHCVIHLVLSISQIAAGRKPKSAEIFPLNELSGNRAAYINEGERLDAPHACFRKFILGLYLPISWLFAVLLMLMVIFEKEQIEKQFTAWKIPEFWKEI